MKKLAAAQVVKIMSKTAGAWGNLLREPMFLTALAAPLIGAGIDAGSNYKRKLDAAKQKTQSYRTMLELHPHLKQRDPQEISRLYSSLHAAAPTMANDPLVAGAWVDNIIEQNGTFGSSNQALLSSIKDLAGIRNNMSSAMRNEGGASTLGSRVERAIPEIGKGVERSMHNGIVSAEEKMVARIDDERQAAQNSIRAYADDMHAHMQSREGELNPTEAQREVLQRWAYELTNDARYSPREKKSEAEDLFGALGL